MRKTLGIGIIAGLIVASVTGYITCSVVHEKVKDMNMIKPSAIKQPK